MTSTEYFVVERRLLNFDPDNDDPRPRPLQIDVSLAVEKEMTIALTGKSVRPGKIVQRVSDTISVVTQEGSSKVETLFHYKCDECAQVFMSSSKYKLHSKDAHNITNPYKCTHCEKAFTLESSMRVHMKTHKNIKLFVCEECGHSFAQKSTWVSHMVRHSGVTPHICNECGKAFATKSDLSTHVRNHRPEKPFTCTECSASFSRKSNFARHMRKHTGEKPYKCSYCNRTFTRTETCREHENLHTKEKPYVCGMCGAAFSNSGNFSKHKRTHHAMDTTNTNLVSRGNTTNTTLSKKLQKLKADNLVLFDQHIDLQIMPTGGEISERSNDTLADSTFGKRQQLLRKDNQQSFIIGNKQHTSIGQSQDLLTLPSHRAHNNGSNNNQTLGSEKTIQVGFTNIFPHQPTYFDPSKQNNNSDVFKTGNVNYPVMQHQEYTSQNTEPSEALKLPEGLNLPLSSSLSTFPVVSSIYNNTTTPRTTINLPQQPLHTYNNTTITTPKIQQQQQQQQQSSQTTPNFTADLHFPQSDLGMNSNQAFMMVDYFHQRNYDSTFSFASDGSLVVQPRAYASAQAISATTPNLGADDFVYNNSNNSVNGTERIDSDQLVESTQDVRVHGNDELCGPAGNHISPILPIIPDNDSEINSENGYGDGVLADGQQPLDTNKFLNEQYFMKKTDTDVLLDNGDHNINTGQQQLRIKENDGRIEEDEDLSSSNFIFNTDDVIYP